MKRLKFSLKVARRIVTTALVMVLTVGCWYGAAHAAGNNLPVPDIGDPSGMLLPQTSSDYTASQTTDPERDKAPFVEQFIGDIINAMTSALTDAASSQGFTPVDQLVFGHDEASVQVFAEVKGRNGHTITATEFTAVAPIYWGFFSLAWFFLVYVAMQAGIKISRGKSNPRVRSSIGETVTNYGVGIILLCLGWYIVFVASDFNLSMMQAMDPRVSAPASSFGSISLTSGDYLLSAIIKLMLVFMSIFINILYVLRKFLLIGAVLLCPFVAVSYATGNRTTISVWLSETLTNAFMPFSHALVFAIYFRLYNWSHQHNNLGLMGKWWVPIVMLFMLIPVSAFYRRIFSSFAGKFLGVSEEGVTSGAGIGFMTGLAGAAAIGSSLFSSFGGKKSPATGASSAATGALSNATQSAGGMALSSVNAGANLRASSASLQTGIGKISPTTSGNLPQNTGGMGASEKPFGFEMMQKSAGSMRERGMSIGSGIGKAAGAALGLGMDMGALAVTGKSTNFRDSFSEIGGRAGRGVGSIAGGVTGGAVGSYQAARRQQQIAKETGTTRVERNIGMRKAFQQAMGFTQEGGSRLQTGQLRRSNHREFVGTLAGSAFGATGARIGGKITRHIGKGLERSGNLKSR